MKASLDDKGNLTIDVRELADALTLEQRADFIRFVVADDVLFDAILECVADDSRWGFFFNAICKPRTAEMRARLMPLMPTIARNLVHAALAERNDAQQEARRTNEWAWKLYHAWPRAHVQQRPETIGYMPTPDVREDELPFPECSICRRRHGSELQHACE